MEFGLFSVCLQLEVYCQTFWMRAWGHGTPKRTLTISNSVHIGMLGTGPLRRSELQSEIETTTKYVSGEGKRRFKGNEFLKGTQLLDRRIFNF